LGEVRGEGMLTAVELVQDRDSRSSFDPAQKIVPRIVQAMGSRGVIARAMPQGDIIGYAPPLCLSREEADTIVSVTVDAIGDVLG
jgi:L-2,4-diaminobutyrate transaminase